MSRRKLFRFSKAITLICLAMSIAITFSLVLLMYKGIVLDGTVICAMYAPFSIELGFNAMISIVDKRNQNKEFNIDE